jgi:hypothetical protein
MSILLIWGVVLMALFCAVLWWEIRRRHMHLWLRAYFAQDWRAPSGSLAQSDKIEGSQTRHLLFCFVDHYEPGWLRPTLEVERQRVARWRQDYPKLCAGHRDADGRAPIHSFFYPEEEYRAEHLDALVEMCRMGLGEIEIHLHHDNDTEAGLREKLRRFTNILADRHDALPRHPQTGQLQWTFIHGNWSLDNCRADGRWCGVNNELIVLREEGCYADFTLPAAPSECQTSTINQIYYATDDPGKPKSHDKGVRMRVGGQPVGDMLMIQGPLGLMWKNRKFGLIPRIESGDIRTSMPPTPQRVDAWVETGIHVQGRPEWIFVKVHTHGTQERDMDTLLGAPMDKAFTHLETQYNDGKRWKLHYVSAREMANIAKAAEAGKTGDPNAYRDYLVARPAYRENPNNSI